jgi:hypothetical protein
MNNMKVNDLPIQYFNQVVIHSQDPWTVKKIKWSSNFREEKDTSLIGTWINTSMNPICENEQKKARHVGKEFATTTTKTRNF